MLTNNEHPTAWAMLIDELSDAHEQLGSLITRMTTAGAIDETDYSVQLGHVFAHLNRAWHGRDDVGLEDVSQELREQRSKFPVDLFPVG